VTATHTGAGVSWRTSKAARPHRCLSPADGESDRYNQACGGIRHVEHLRQAPIKDLERPCSLKAGTTAYPRCAVTGC